MTCPRPKVGRIGRGHHVVRRGPFGGRCCRLFVVHLHLAASYLPRLTAGARPRILIRAAMRSGGWGRNRMPRNWWRGVPLAVLLLSGGAQAADSFFKEPLKLDLSAPFTGPDGVPATPASALLLSADDIASIQGGNHKAALLWHGGGDWVAAVNKGATDRFKELGVVVVATADAQYDPAKQANDIETALALQPSAILTPLLAPVRGAAALGPAVEKGVKVVLLSNPAKGFSAGKEYVGIVTDDIRGMGVAAAEMMADALGGGGGRAFFFQCAYDFHPNGTEKTLPGHTQQ